ncbi:hypothetical protein SAMN05660909_05246 [Chitinophaga terrae (ex Kim and Jung 2007)]|uniref:Uncharacterized protein n=1 Tax=Chitinophaga terrae (ex Kim and Jung 2007) TaxID=408074 RepID=A0A1H4GG39_9BACT|nr:hypothetical protein [Chitinophaga terrae (ex Kim and Jung 2007)]GEP93376.1 hypothetical protein CTE07_50210 [Chitinophaga terrae (ex Kim and Jung 2007)]SEB07980.1 hypothetical protein SAMN05660909_05246 [Chitinophaga terrae (ex Kim and Jung 2007)]
MGNVAKETKALYCTDYNNVNAAARWMESVTLTLGDPVFFYRKSADAIVDQQRAIYPKYKE